MGPIYTLEDVIDMLRRRAMLVFAVTVLGALAAVFLALSTPHEYQAVEVIQVERPLIADEMAPSIVEGSSGRRLQSVQHQMTSRGTLLDIIEHYGIYDDLPAMSLAEKAQALREAIRLEGVAAARDGTLDDGELSALTIVVRLGDPRQAQQVAREISQRTVELYAARRIDEATTTLQFFSNQEEQLFGQLQALEDEIAEYRAGQQISLPGSVEFTRTQIAALSTALLDIEREMIGVQRQLDQIDTEERRQVTVEREVRALEAELLNLREQRALLEARQSALTASLETSPEVERRLGDYERELAQLREQFDVVSTRKAEAEVALRLETERKSERLVILEQADIPEHPVTPSRKRTVILGTGAAMILGVVLAFLLELRHPVIRTAQQMEREIGITPVITLPNVAVSRRKPGRLARLRAWFNGQVPVTTQSEKPRKMRQS
ncbi:GumC family protein [Aestuariivita boseongensis]|uniref:GumC family protein n=1 Tax=Aestuariivita boseongensis TaxID=1470562 RepID=UPI000681C5FC|nr:Wzz/FepE/Etk N-terminal domain-containing protein [Aestuariivita boseongensis]